MATPSRRKLISCTHPRLAPRGRSLHEAPSFSTVEQLKRQVDMQLKLQFCDICLDSRKVRAAARGPAALPGRCCAPCRLPAALLGRGRPGARTRAMAAAAGVCVRAAAVQQGGPGQAHEGARGWQLLAAAGSCCSCWPAPAAARLATAAAHCRPGLHAALLPRSPAPPGQVGDESGPLADSGFKGHPLCRFCKRRFYDTNELFKHMESAHEQCFICRRVQPDKYVYYRDYAELEGGRRRCCCCWPGGWLGLAGGWGCWGLAGGWGCWGLGGGCRGHPGCWGRRGCSGC
jgi:hypothetical protein